MTYHDEIKADLAKLKATGSKHRHVLATIATAEAFVRRGCRSERTNEDIDVRHSLAHELGAVDRGERPTPERRRCMWISPTQSFNPNVDTDGYVPSLVTEGEAGHSPMMGRGEGAAPWYWGMTLEEAQQTCDSYNRDTFGLEPIEAQKIVASSIGAGALGSIALR